jgi:hypothetical protein
VANSFTGYSIIGLFKKDVFPCSWYTQSGFVQSARPRPTALLSPRSDGKLDAATAVVVAPDDGHEDARNMLSCI